MATTMTTKTRRSTSTANLDLDLFKTLTLEQVTALWFLAHGVTNENCTLDFGYARAGFKYNSKYLKFDGHDDAWYLRKKGYERLLKDLGELGFPAIGSNTDFTPDWVGDPDADEPEELVEDYAVLMRKDDEEDGEDPSEVEPLDPAHLTSSELEDLLNSYHSAQHTPVILVGEVDMAQEAWNAFNRKWAEVARAHDLDPDKYGFNSETGEIVKKE